ncbi:hypothetical protein KC902_00510 [Candidatus Kaiserbacteria bacterium]|nr:hypothetical protein [Candidatus Kaiserbacteria bacterium]
MAAGENAIRNVKSLPNNDANSVSQENSTFSNEFSDSNQAEASETFQNDTSTEDNRVNSSGVRNVVIEHKKTGETKPGHPVQNGVKAVGTTAQATGAGIEVAGGALQVAGKTAKVAGAATSAAGAALTATGVGAVVGIPLTIAGRAVGIAGTVTDKTGKVVRKGGKTIRKTGKRLKKVAKKYKRAARFSPLATVRRRDTGVSDLLPGYARDQRLAIYQKANPFKKVSGAVSGTVGFLTSKSRRATIVTRGIWYWSIPIYLFVQIPFAILVILFLGIGLAVDTVFGSSSVEGQKGFWDGVWNVAKKVITSVAEAINAITTYLLNIDLGSLHPGGLFLLFYELFLGLFLFQLLVIYFIYKLSLINPIFGEGSGKKITVFLLTIVGLSIPGLNLLPWAIFWTLAVWKNPK